MSMTMKSARMRTQGAAQPGLDQGGLLSTIGSIAGALPGIGGTVGGILGVGRQLLGRGGRGMAAPMPQIPRGLQIPMGRGFPLGPVGGAVGGIVGTAVGRTVTGRRRARAGERFQDIRGKREGSFYVDQAEVKPACPPGYHPNKSSYYRKTHDGTGVIFVPKGHACVKKRRRNALNPKALTKAISRVKSAKTASKKLSKITIRS